MPEYATELIFSKAIKGSLDAPFTACVYVTNVPELLECLFHEVRLSKEKAIDGMETTLDLQEPTSKTARTWIVGPGCWAMDEDGDRGIAPWDFEWQKFVFKEVLDQDGKQTEAMAWIALGVEGKTVVTTENWKD